LAILPTGLGQVLYKVLSDWLVILIEFSNTFSKEGKVWANQKIASKNVQIISLNFQSTTCKIFSMKRRSGPNLKIPKNPTTIERVRFVNSYHFLFI
jgi:hypothetical protein